MAFVRTRVDIVEIEKHTCKPRYGWNDSRRIVCLDEGEDNESEIHAGDRGHRTR